MMHRNARQTGLPKAKSDNVFGRARRSAKMFRAGLYARVSSMSEDMLLIEGTAESAPAVSSCASPQNRQIEIEVHRSHDNAREDK